MSRLAFFGITFAVASACACSEGSLPTNPPDTGAGPTVASVALSGPAEPLSVGGSAQLTATVYDTEGDRVEGATIAWSSSDEDVVSVSGTGLATAVAPGDATVHARSGGKSGSLDIEVAETTTEPPLPPPAGRRGSIAYVKDDQIRLIEPDGSNDRLVWALPDTTYSITGVSWRPDGGEIAFASDHEMAYSIYERDIYAIRPDGSGLRKLTNGPLHSELEGLPSGSVSVTVQNLTFDPGPYFVYMTGAPEPKLVTVGAAGSVRVIFEEVADLGEGVHQTAVVINGIHRWWNAAAGVDVQPGVSADAGTVSISPNPFEHFGADVPFWRGDGSAVGFIGSPTCLLQRVPVAPQPGHSFTPLVDPDTWDAPCGVDWSPIAGATDPLLVADGRDYTFEGRTHIHRVPEGSDVLNTPAVTFEEYVQVVDIRWLPDGSGFLVARHDGLVDMDINIYAFDFESRTLEQVTDLEGEYVRSFSVSPDGQFIAFERITGGDPYELAHLSSDLWVMRRDGSEARLLVPDARLPAW